MLKRLGGSSNSLWKPKNPHSLEYLKYLYTVLVKNEKVTDNNRKILVEALRAIAEILIWGDQNDSTVFDFFLEKQMLSFFHNFMKQDSGSLNVQLLQNLNILFENIRHETSLYFLLSNNMVNSIISHSFDFSNEEIMAYYISFLKTLSFKLNPCTIHFFFTEKTSQQSTEFPLLTEALKLHNFSESMVRIAVRNVVLNVVRVNDPAMLDYVKVAIKQYLCDLIDCLVAQAIDLDTFIRSAENVLANRERLRDKVDDLIDVLHYIGELLEVETIAEKLSDLVINRFLVPLLLNSLAPRRDNASVLLTPVSSLFFFSEFLLVVSHQKTIQSFLGAFLFENCTLSKTHWVRESDHYNLMGFDDNSSLHRETRAFFDALLGAFDASNNDDYLSFYGLMLIYAMLQNRAEVGELLSCAKIPFFERGRSRRSNTQGVEFGEEALPSQPNSPQIACDQRIMDALLSVVAAAGKDDSRLRPITLELACLVLRQLLLLIDADQMHNAMQSTASRIRSSLCEKLAPHVFTENLFLEWFEDEFAEFEINHIKFDVIGYEMLLPPCATPLSGLPLNKRLPSGFEEKIRNIIQLYLNSRKLEKDLLGESDLELPLSINNDAVAVGDCINLNNSDLLSCNVVPQKGDRQSRFLVTDRLQLILVEPDSKKAGWAIVRFVGLLQDTQISGDPLDSRSLHIVVEGQPSRTKKRQAILTAKFIFDDHIRCMAAKQRLTKGRQTARGIKLQAIADVLGVKQNETMSPRANPFRIVKGCLPGSVRKEQVSPAPGSVYHSMQSLNSIPDDPEHSKANTSRIKHV